jgi:hypothetical protein
VEIKELTIRFGGSCVTEYLSGLSWTRLFAVSSFAVTEKKLDGPVFESERC